MQHDTRLRPTLLILILLLAPALSEAREELRLPWKDAGLTEHEAAAHLLDRFAYGPRPGEVERVVGMGLGNWLARQLQGGLPDPDVDRVLRRFKSLGMTTRDIVETYPGPGLVLAEAREKGFIGGEAQDASRRRMSDPATRDRVIRFARQQGYRPQRELIGEAMAAKLYRAAYSENQLTEVLTDFWFNHFNVSITDTECRVFVPTYERDAIRPFVTGDFRDMLVATAKHPAMLLYLDNARSVAGEDAKVRFDRDRFRGRFGSRGGRGFRNRGFGSREGTEALSQRPRPSGLNENYARELLELHTLGVDGGYTQDDVIEVARAFTGWTTYPPGPMRERTEERIAQARSRMARAGLQNRTGFVFEDDFVFRADAHDAGRKAVLGKKLPAGQGIEDGLAVLAIVAAHPSTARHLATKLARRFVSDEPPASLVDRLARVYLDSRGDLGRLVVALAESPEFWGAGGAGGENTARRQKIKSPFELAVSALRVTGARLTDPRATVEWISRMGQPLYAYQAPTGYPDRADFWVNTGSLLSRMNFGLQLATGRVAGVKLDLAALDGRREPESLEAALATYAALLLPGRETAPTIDRLGPVIRDPELARKVEEAQGSEEVADLDLDDWDGLEDRPGRRFGRGAPPPPVEIDSSPLAHVVGVILGSPEFQRR